MDVSTIKDDIGEIELGELTANRVFTHTDNTVENGDEYTLTCTDTLYTVIRINVATTGVTETDGAATLNSIRPLMVLLEQLHCQSKVIWI